VVLLFLSRYLGNVRTLLIKFDSQAWKLIEQVQEIIALAKEEGLISERDADDPRGWFTDLKDAA
jgi:hypothetical protein